MIKMKKIEYTVEEAFNDFITSKRANGLQEKTLLTYQQHFRAIGKELDFETDIRALSKREIEEAISRLRTRLSSNSVRSYTATLKSFFSWTNEEGLTELSIKLFKAEETVKDTYSTEELQKLLKKPNMRAVGFPEYRNWVIINLLLNSGCRASTIRNILIKDLDLDNQTIQYRHTKNKSVQVVPLCSDMKRILKEYLKIREGNENDYLFPNENGSMMTEYGLNEAVRRYNRARGVSKTSIHLFRHTFAERYLKQGGNPFDLQRILGHSTLQMTKHYCRIYDKELIKNYDKFSPLQNL